MKLLYIDDSIEILELVSQYLSDYANFTILVTNDEHEALSLIAERVIDLVVTEVDLRPVSGIELYRTTRTIAPDMPFIFVTTYPPAPRLRELLEQEQALRVVYKDGYAGSFLPTLRRTVLEVGRRRSYRPQ